VLPLARSPRAAAAPPPSGFWLSAVLAAPVLSLLLDLSLLTYQRQFRPMPFQILQVGGWVGGGEERGGEGGWGRPAALASETCTAPQCHLSMPRPHAALLARMHHHRLPARQTPRTRGPPLQEAEVKARFQAEMAAGDVEGQARQGLEAFAPGAHGAEAAKAGDGLPQQQQQASTDLQGCLLGRLMLRRMCGEGRMCLAHGRFIILLSGTYPPCCRRLQELPPSVA
jgi:hypothetical protein